MKEIIYILLLLAAGFFIGRKTIEEQEPKIVYEKGETITDTLELEPDTIEVPTIKWYPLKADTIWLTDTYTIVQVTDTAAVLADYILRRHYNETLFDSDTAGTLNISTYVQYNKLEKLEYEFTPILVTKTIHEKRFIVPYAKASINTHKYFSIGGGIFINDLGIGADYVNDLLLEDQGWEFSLLKKF